MTVNNKKESWLSHGQDPARCLPPLSLPFSRASALSSHILSAWKLPPCPFDTAMINCSNIKVYMDQCMIVTFSKRFSVSRCWRGGGSLAAFRVQVLSSPSIHRKKCKKPFSCHPSLILPPLYAIVYGLLLRITSLFYFSLCANSFQNEVSGFCLVSLSAYIGLWSVWGFITEAWLIITLFHAVTLSVKEQYNSNAKKHSKIPFYMRANTSFSVLERPNVLPNRPLCWLKAVNPFCTLHCVLAKTIDTCFIISWEDMFGTSRFKCCISSHIKTTWNGLLWDNAPFNNHIFFCFVWHKRHFFSINTEYYMQDYHTACSASKAATQQKFPCHFLKCSRLLETCITARDVLGVILAAL